MPPNAAPVFLCTVCLWKTLPDRSCCPTLPCLQLPGGTPQRLAWGWLARLLQRTAEAAPGPMEAALSEQMRRAAAQPKGATAEIMGRYMPEVLQVSAPTGAVSRALRG